MVFVVNIHLQRFLTLPSRKVLLYVISGSFSPKRGRAVQVTKRYKQD